MPLSAPAKPDDSIERLLAALLPESHEINVVPRKRLHWEYKGEAQLYLFMQGEVSVLRATDGLVIASAYDSHLFGLAESLQSLRCHILRVETASTILRVGVGKAMEIFDRQNLWRDVAITLAYFNSYLFYRNDLVVQQRTYSVIRDHLQEMIQLPLATRMRTSILEYIQERTHLSRSSVLNVIFALKSGSYIEVKRGGYLIAMKHLPEKF
ncbi:Crp/Fnr family transcriptional regulator [Buttiauxella warmboldiae]|uniref:Crp/Fnr family transcriptional regulator n=1 Tax=Buttiauxella warmboldiae TaxID=82993 RepID=A0A3N5E9A1_9ENTR|nr:helix-turn-helix domain-containing protein [Buttiauxella warmboldiae]RPH28823.1 Crp/Fnr family transcriptional regulator [Buttiauxella warmboldiae]